MRLHRQFSLTSRERFGFLIERGSGTENQSSEILLYNLGKAPKLICEGRYFDRKKPRVQCVEGLALLENLIFDPVTGKKLCLPSLDMETDNDCFYSSSFYFMGFNPASYKYKVLFATVRLSLLSVGTTAHRETVYNILTLGQSRWRDLSMDLECHNLLSNNPSETVCCCVKGVLYLYPYRTRFIFAFDLATENLNLINFFEDYGVPSIIELHEFEEKVVVFNRVTNSFWILEDKSCGRWKLGAVDGIPDMSSPYYFLCDLRNFPELEGLLQGYDFHRLKYVETLYDPKLIEERKEKFCIITSDGSRSSSLNLDGTRTRKLIPNAAVVEKQDDTTASTGSKSGHELLLSEYPCEGLDEEMDRDPNACVMGEDVGHYGGSYNVTKGLVAKFDDLRVPEPSIAEIGAAISGLCPAVKGLNMGFLLLVFNHISNKCGMLHYTSVGQFKIPVVIHRPGGVGRQLGAEHSQRLESYFHLVPGIQMVACSNSYNAKGLMEAAIRSEKTVILFEKVFLYNLKERIPDEECCILNLEEAEMVRPGGHVTVLMHSRMSDNVMQAVKTLVNKGYNPEVTDIIFLKPFHFYAIGNSLKKTDRVLTVEESMCRGGIGASSVASINENFRDCLDAPIVCLSSQDVPTPCAA